MLLPNHPAGQGKKPMRLPRRLLNFVRETDGGVTLFSLFIFLMMLLMAGMAVDLMRFESKRSRLQNTIDSAVLAAANLNQAGDADAIVRDFFEKSGYDGSKVQIAFTENKIGQDADGNGGEVVGKTVTAALDIDMNTYFMGLIGIESLHSISAGRATESVQGIEISMVLDISGSMSGSRIADLKTSAKNFLGIVLEEERVASQVATTSISIVPYNATVVAPDYLLSRLNTQDLVTVTPSMANFADPTDFAGALVSFDREAPNSQCVQFTDDQMVTTDLNADYQALRAIAPTTPLQRVAYFDEGNKGSGAGGDYHRPADDWNRWCDPTRSQIVVHETRKEVLDTAIDNLSAGGWTSIDNGMKWGTALLDPAMRPVINELVDANILQEEVRDRPGNYGGVETQKIVIVMTDGTNTYQKDIKNDYKRGPSPIWFSPVTAGANFDESEDDSANYFNGFFVFVDDADDTDYWYQGEDPTDETDGILHDKDDLPVDAYQLTYTELYDRFSENAVASLVDDSGVPVLNTLYNNLTEAVWKPNQNAELDRRLNGYADNSQHGICDAARVDNDILVFTIAFEAPTGGETQMRQCATSEGYYFDASNGTELDEAFQAIAAQITKLRLTQ